MTNGNCVAKVFHLENFTKLFNLAANICCCFQTKNDVYHITEAEIWFAESMPEVQAC